VKKQEALRKLQDLVERSHIAEEGEALRMAMDALKRQRDFRKVGAKGGQATLAKHGRKALSAWGKLGGRPPKKKT